MTVEEAFEELLETLDRYDMSRKEKDTWISLLEARLTGAGDEASRLESQLGVDDSPPIN